MEHAISLSSKQIESNRIVESKHTVEAFGQRQQTIMDKLKILTDAAKYVAYTIALAFTDIPK